MLLLWHAMMPGSLAATRNDTQAVLYNEQLLHAAAQCQFGLFATGSSGAVMQSHAAIAASTYKTLLAGVELPLVSGVMQTIGCASESVDGFKDTFKTTPAEGDPFPGPFWTADPDRAPPARVPKSDYAQTHTRGTLKGLYADIYTRYTAMMCLNSTAGAGAACQHRTVLACANTSQMFGSMVAQPDPDPTVEPPGGCFQLAMEWSVPGGKSAWTNVMPHEIWKGLVANDTAGVAAIDQALLASIPSYRAQSIITDNPLVTQLPPCNPQHTFLARTQALANLQAYQAVSPASPSVRVEGPSRGFVWHLLQLPRVTDLLDTLALRACQYSNATASQLQLCHLAPARLRWLEAQAPRPTGNFCYINSSALDARVLQGVARNVSQAVVGVASETDVASAIFDLQTVALIVYPATSVTTLLLAISGAVVSVVTCEKQHIRQGITRISQRAFTLVTRCICTGPVKRDHMHAVVSYAVYAVVSLTIAGPGIAIIVTNIQYSKASLTATVVATSGPITESPQLELIISETVKLLYKPKNFLLSLTLGCALCALSLLWGISRGMRAARQPVEEDAIQQSVHDLRAIKVQVIHTQLQHLGLAKLSRGQHLVSVSSA